MNRSSNHLKQSVIEYCASIGQNPLLVQGAGGNVSWKEGDTLWIKASGTWLSEALEKDIFVPVDLSQLRCAIEAGDFAVTPRLSNDSVLRSSIETLLHALMPQRVVVHVHAIEALAHLVRVGCQADLMSLLDPGLHWTMVDYDKPGAALAQAVCGALAQKPDADVVFLKNHGVVIGGDDVDEVSQILNRVIEALSCPAVTSKQNFQPVLSPRMNRYVPIEETDIHRLAFDTHLFNRLGLDWALYPDHVVFLGARAYTYRSWEDFYEENQENSEPSEIIFIHGAGVFVTADFNAAKRAQLRCYYDVLIRQPSDASLNALNHAQIMELLNWDAEQYRMQLRNELEK